MITSLSDLLQQSNANYRVYDLGRRVTPLGNDVFADVEAQRQPYPTPLQHHACFAICFWEQPDQPFMWLLKMPLDERGLLDVAVRDQFCENVVTLLGQQITHTLTDEQQQQLQQSAALYSPPPEKLAALNARVKVDLEQPPSIYFEAAQAYLRAPAQDDSWQDIAVQGLHDVAARLATDNHTAISIVRNFANYPEPLQQPLVTALEHQRLPDEAYEHALQNLSLQQNNADISKQLLMLQLLSGVPAEKQLGSQLRAKLADLLMETSEALVFVLIAGRHYTQLAAAPELLETFFTGLANQQNDPLFKALFADLVSLPGLRTHLLVLAQRNDLPQHLAVAIAKLRGTPA